MDDFIVYLRLEQLVKASDRMRFLGSHARGIRLCKLYRSTIVALQLTGHNHQSVSHHIIVWPKNQPPQALHFGGHFAVMQLSSFELLYS